MYSLRVLIGCALLVLAKSTILRRSITNGTTIELPSNSSSMGTTSQNTTTSSSLSTSAHIAAQNQTQVKPADEGVKPATDGLRLSNEIVKPIINNRRKNKKSTSTSSSSNEKSGEGSQESNKESLDLTATSESSSDSKKKDNNVSKERKGWRKWHRRCTPCPEEMKKKWRDPSIGWICGGYQRARRSFKSTCMMYLRNCQDGTMFEKIHNHRCEDDNNRNSSVALRHGDHFFYEYRVVLSGDASNYADKSVSSSKGTSDSSSETD